MFNACKLRSPRRGEVSMFAVGLFAVIVILLPIPARAQCGYWTAAGEWTLEQGTRGFGFDPVQLKLVQQGRLISGTASRKAMGVSGSVTGKVSGDNFSLEIAWSDGTAGVYSTTVQPSGKLQGDMYYKDSPQVHQPWFSEGVLRCDPSPPPIRSSGKAPKTDADPRPSADARARPGQAVGSLLRTSTMVASQPVFPTPYVSTGFVVLTWDAGPDHPNADVWVKVGRDRVLLMKQPKGGQQIVVQRGQMYEYVLMDGRTVLATTTVAAY